MIETAACGTGRCEATPKPREVQSTRLEEGIVMKRLFKWSALAGVRIAGALTLAAEAAEAGSGVLRSRCRRAARFC